MGVGGRGRTLPITSILHLFSLYSFRFFTPPQKKVGGGGQLHTQFFTLKFKKNLKVPRPPMLRPCGGELDGLLFFLQGLKPAKKKEQLINYKDSHFFSIYILKTIHRLMTGPFLNRRKYTQRQSFYGDI